MFRKNYTDYTLEIDTGVENAFELIKDIDNWKTWGTQLRKSYMKTEGAFGVGSKFGFWPKILPFPVTPVSILEYVENKVIKWGINKVGLTMIHGFEFEALGAKKCRVRHFEYTEGLLTIIMLPGTKLIRRYDERWSDEMKAHLET